MLILKVIAVSLGLTFTLFGYLIHFKKKYDLVNGFDADFRAGRKTESYASQIGLIVICDRSSYFGCSDSFDCI